MSEKKPNRQKSSNTSGTNEHPFLQSTASSIISFDESTVLTKYNATNDRETRLNLEAIAFVCFDLPFQTITILFGTLRAINDYIQIFTDSSLCLDWIRSSSNSIFFISSSHDRDLIAAVHDCRNVEAIFILNPKVEVSKNDFPKLIGVFNQHEELFMVLNDIITWFELSKLEVFAFEDENIFLWSQLWKDEVNKLRSDKGDYLSSFASI
jgi:hypothetical protein